MKKVLIIISLFTVTVSVSAQSFCEGKALIGMEIVPQGFQYRVQAERFAAEVFNFNLVGVQQSYCLIVAAGKSERRLEVKTSIRKMDRDEIPETDWKKMGIQIGGNILADIVIGAIPREYRGYARKQKKQYLPEPRYYVEPYYVSAETYMYEGRNLIWKGYNTRIMVVKITQWPGVKTKPDKVEFISYDPQGQADTVGKLQPYNRVLEIPQGTKDLGPRYREFMKYITALGALEKNNIEFQGNFIPSGRELLRQR